VESLRAALRRVDAESTEKGARFGDDPSKTAGLILLIVLVTGGSNDNWAKHGRFPHKRGYSSETRMLLLSKKLRPDGRKGAT